MLRLRRGASAPGVLVALSVAALLATHCADPLTENECQLLLDRYTELLLREEQPDVSPMDLMRKKDQARAAARSDPRFEFARCPVLVSRRQYDCAMAAPNVDGVERCLVL